MNTLNRKRGALFAIIVVNLLVWSISIRNGFVYDDNVILLGNPWVRDFGRIGEVFASSMMAFDPMQPPANTYRPMLYAVFMAEYSIFGLNPCWFHALNILLHAANGVMVFLLAGRFFDAGEKRLVLPALFAALAFSVHTINSEAVNWVSASAELLFTLCVLSALYIHTGRESVPGAIASALLFFTALLFKETAAAFLPLAVACDIAFRRPVSRNWKAYAMYGASVAVYGGMRFFAVGGLMHHKQIDFSFTDTVINIFPLVSIYFSKLVFPANLSAMYEFHPARSVSDLRVLAGLVMTAAFMAALFFARKRPVIIAGLFIMAVPLLPVLYVPALASSAIADRYLYLPSAGFAMAVAALAPMLDGKARRVFLAFFSAVLVMWAAGSISRSLVWQSDYTLWADAVKKAPNMPNAHYNYAWASQNAGNLRDAVLHYREAARLSPSADAHFNLGMIFMGQSLVDEAEAEFRAALAVDPRFDGARVKLMEIQRIRKAGA